MKTFNITFPFQVKFHPSPISPRAFISSVEPYACANTIATILFRHPLNWVIRSHKASRAWNARNKRSLHVSRTQIALWILRRERERNDPFGMGNRYLHDPWNVTRPHRRYYESERRGFEFRGMDFRILYERNIVGESVRCGGGASCVRRGGGAISRKFWLDSSLNVGRNETMGRRDLGTFDLSLDLNFVRLWSIRESIRGFRLWHCLDLNISRVEDGNWRWRCIKLRNRYRISINGFQIVRVQCGALRLIHL